LAKFRRRLTVEDLYSRYGVALEVHESESGEHAAELLEKTIWREQLHGIKPCSTAATAAR